MKSTITITDGARSAFPRLPSEHDDEQRYKNWLLEKVRANHPELYQSIGIDKESVLEFATDHYQPLGLQVIIMRCDGIHVWIGAIGECADNVKNAPER